MKLTRKHALGVLASFAISGLTTASIADESAQAGVARLKIDVSANCKGEDAYFRIRNSGEAWPKTSTFRIYNMRKGKRKLISKRRMRLKDGQRASFKIRTAKLPTNRIGIWVKPGWYQREFAYDATIRCG